MAYTPKGSKAKSEGIRVARLIAAGLVGEARREASGYRWPARTVPEARAINGACDYVAKAFGVKLNPGDFLYPPQPMRIEPAETTRPWTGHPNRIDGDEMIRLQRLTKALG